MKPRKAILTAAAVTTLFSAGGCVFNEVQCVYGPPPDDSPFVAQFETSETAEYDPADNIMQAMYGVPDYREPVEFDPADNMTPDVYGPPRVETTEFDPYENINQPEYGVPEDLYSPESGETSESTEANEMPDTAEISEQDPLAVTTESEQVAASPETAEATELVPDFNPEMNIEQCVYGPPEWFE